jgi:hypothetical protein
MNIIGRLKNELIIKCKKGFFHKHPLYHSYYFTCEHEKEVTYYDMSDVVDLNEITDKNVISSLENNKNNL